MAREIYIKDLMARIEKVEANINEACHEAHGDCQYCRYEALCRTEIEYLNNALDKAKACRLDKPKTCSECKYVGICSYGEARKHIEKLKKEALIEICSHQQEDCLDCSRFGSCDLDHAFYMKQLIKNARCREPYACRTCTYGNCHFKKGEHVKHLMKKLKEKVCMIDPMTECKDCPKKFYCSYCEARVWARIEHIESMEKKCRAYYKEDCMNCPKLNVCELEEAKMKRECIHEHGCDKPYACMRCDNRHCEFAWKRFKLELKLKKLNSK